MFGQYSIIIFVVILSVSGQFRRTLYEDDKCKSDDPRWICKRLSACPSAQQAIRAGEWPDTCGFVGTEPIVCCRPIQTQRPSGGSRPSQQGGSGFPSSSRPQHGGSGGGSFPSTSGSSGRPTTSVLNRNSKAKEMCKKYAKYVFREEKPPVLLASSVDNDKTIKFDDCARNSQPLIVGGTDAVPKEFPHMAQIGYGESPRIAWLCGGSLISERFILSAAHCTKPASRGPAKWARLGDLNTATDTDDARTVIVRIAERYDHPDYNSNQMYNDIALYKLEHDVQLNGYVRPICLDVGDKQIEEAVATGWGHTAWGGRGSATLKKVSLNLVSVERCNQSYEFSIGRQLPNGIVGSYMLCAGDEEGKDTCQGDSGGPLQIALKEPYCMYSQLGVTSFGRECGSNIPGVYSRVSTYVPWIERIVWP